VEDCRTEGGYVGSEEGPSDQEKYYLLCRVRLSPRLKRRRLSESTRLSEADCSTVSCTAFVHVMEKIDGYVDYIKDIKLRDVCILLESTLLFFSSICSLFFSLCDRRIYVSLSMYILLDLEDVTDFEGQSFAFRLDIESASYISEDIAQALCE
uniref:FERM domain-containing protein n=1 Tax=Angiostrongylus cantonensis TaxID=6313 RepID=A0A0K0D6N0_ANGCA